MTETDTTSAAPEASAAPTAPASPPPPPAAHRPLRPIAVSLIGVADLVIDLVVLGIAWTVLTVLIPLGGGLILLVGIGALILALIPWFLRGYSIVERHRTGAVYGIDIPGLPRRRTGRTGFAGVLHQWWLDASDATPWRALAHLIAGSVITWLFAALAFIGTGSGIGLLAFGIARAGEAAEPFTRATQWLEGLPGWAIPIIGAAMLAVGLCAALFYGFVDRAFSAAVLGASRASILQHEIAAVSAQRSSAVAAAEHQRTSIERDLHDGVQPRLVSVAMTLGMARAKFDGEPEEARKLLDTAHGETKDAITELRRLARGLHPAVLEDRGLDAALSAIVARSPVPVALDVDLPGRCSSQTEAVVYFAVSEALTNIAKHARATRCSIRVDRVGDRVVASVTDDGIGGAVVGAAGAPAISAGGLAGIRDRAVAAGGSLRVSSPVGGPTVVTVEVPCES